MVEINVKFLNNVILYLRIFFMLFPERRPISGLLTESNSELRGVRFKIIHFTLSNWATEPNLIIFQS